MGLCPGGLCLGVPIREVSVWGFSVRGVVGGISVGDPLGIIKASGTHPTGMLSCDSLFSLISYTGDDYIFKQAYVGCYEDQSPTDVNTRDLETLLIYNWNGVTVETCISACQTLGYSKAALQVCDCDVIFIAVLGLRYRLGLKTSWLCCTMQKVFTLDGLGLRSLLLIST